MPQPIRSASVRAATHRMWVTVVLVATLLVVSACASSPGPAPSPAMITEKGTPHADLLVPELHASVTDSAIGVAVDSPVTVTAGNGVLGQVSLTNESGEPVDGQLTPDGVSWSST